MVVISPKNLQRQILSRTMIKKTMQKSEILININEKKLCSMIEMHLCDRGHLVQPYLI